ncbi:hypothetical protein CUP0446 [Campylobacter upsaliensis RM3195]|nr:hypothetical protein CUP0446 [Campylobacter upsaliensis RM3195]
MPIFSTKPLAKTILLSKSLNLMEEEPEFKTKIFIFNPYCA